MLYNQLSKIIFMQFNYFLIYLLYRKVKKKVFFLKEKLQTLKTEKSLRPIKSRLELSIKTR